MGVPLHHALHASYIYLYLFEITHQRRNRHDNIQEKFLQDRIKVEGKTGILGDKVKITREEKRIIVNAQLPFSKRYLKYLTKKYLKKQGMRDYIRVIADDKNKGVYTVCYYKSDKAAADE
mmetsp:Transcript_19590/g.36209  ORF Transcript_19590/g.36209 Transcript_19590/m.36209 type:complete len:120 (+) Transcript_19590:49-408(+)|eukprot:CAMPEP_0184521994 /NCGR_PEP_ID=MMETSP0198_2-20121128/8026_1 /TAXON_ID=1112570 /ORGANISM="Thraustochytrium sp., Strain LLF1b" /LENGTH=119 /DNA_ID=CAMNT_0026912753 /DNA_START=349 /DNA_END=708 /DNA_ORIENTATION=-